MQLGKLPEDIPIAQQIIISLELSPLIFFGISEYQVHCIGFAFTRNMEGATG